MLNCIIRNHISDFRTDYISFISDAFEKLNLGPLSPLADQTQHNKESISDSDKVYFRFNLLKTVSHPLLLSA